MSVEDSWKKILLSQTLVRSRTRVEWRNEGIEPHIEEPLIEHVAFPAVELSVDISPAPTPTDSRVDAEESSAHGWLSNLFKRAERQSKDERPGGVDWASLTAEVARIAHRQALDGDRALRQERRQDLVIERLEGTVVALASLTSQTVSDRAIRERLHAENMAAQTRLMEPLVETRTRLSEISERIRALEQAQLDNKASLVGDMRSQKEAVLQAIGDTQDRLLGVKSGLAQLDLLSRSNSAAIAARMDQEREATASIVGSAFAGLRESYRSVENAIEGVKAAVHSQQHEQKKATALLMEIDGLLASLPSEAETQGLLAAVHAKIDVVLASLPSEAETQGLLTAVHAKMEDMAQAASASSDLRDIFLDFRDDARRNAQVTSRALKRGYLPYNGDRIAIRCLSAYIVAPSNDLVVTALYEAGELEPQTTQILCRACPPGGVFVDIGASYGLTVTPVAQAIGPRGRIIAFEPSPTTADCLRQTLKLNGLDKQSDVREIALSDKSGLAKLSVGATSTWNSLYPLPDPDGEITVMVSTLDSEIEVGAHIDVLKIDVEGAEIDVLRGATRVLSENPGAVIVAEFGIQHLSRARVTAQAWFDAFSDRGWTEAYVIDDHQATPPRALTPDQIEGLVSANIIFLQPGSVGFSRLGLQ